MINKNKQDLWQALSEASGFDIKSFMDPFTKTTGYPLISITSTSKENEFEVEQQRFFANGKKDESNLLWWVNIGIKLSGNFFIT